MENKKLQYAVSLVRPLQLIAILQECKTTSIIMLSPLLDKLTSSLIFMSMPSATSQQEDKGPSNNALSCSQDLKHVNCKMFVIQYVIV